MIETARERYEERAAIIEHEAKMPRMKAESMALREVSEKYGKEVAKRIKEEMK